jgi:hypothetical protein
MRNFVIFALLIGGPLFYLWEHARSFGLQQDIAKLQEQRQRMEEVCDSLSACIGALNSNYRIEAEALALGMTPKFARAPLLVPLALAVEDKRSGKSPGPGRARTGAARKAGSGSKPRPGTRTGSNTAGAPPGSGQKPIASEF